MIKLKKMIDKYKIYCDMDGCLTNFDGNFKNLLPNGNKYKDGWSYEEKYGKKAFWDVVATGGLKFWSHMSWMPDGKILWNYIKDKNTEILSAPSKSIPESITGKKMWVNRELKNSSGLTPKLNLIKSEYKQKYALKNCILIDDLESNIIKWIKSGGIGILHTSAHTTIKKLQKLGI